MIFNSLGQGYSTSFSKGPDLADENSLDPGKVENIWKRSKIYGDQNLVEEPPKELANQISVEDQKKFLIAFEDRKYD